MRWLFFLSLFSFPFLSSLSLSIVSSLRQNGASALANSDDEKKNGPADLFTWLHPKKFHRLVVAMRILQAQSNTHSLPIYLLALEIFRRD